MKRVRLAMVSVLLMAPAAFAQIYKWTDANGQVHYSDRPTKDAQVADLKPISFTGMPILGEVGDAGSATPRLRMYSAQWCGVCRKARAWLASHHVAYDEIDVDSSASAKEAFKRAGGKGYPYFVSGRRTMLGFSERRMQELLAAP